MTKKRRSAPRRPKAPSKAARGGPSSREAPPRSVSGIHEALEANCPPGGWESLEQVNAFLSAHMEALNTTPQLALHGLTPVEAGQLFHSTWLGDGPIRLRLDLDDEPWDAHPAMRTTRAILAEWARRGVVRTTKTGKISARTVGAIADEVGEAIAELALPVPMTPREARAHTADYIATLFEAGLLVDGPGGVVLSRDGERMARGLEPGRLAALVCDARLRVVAPTDTTEFDTLVVGVRQPAMVIRALWRMKHDEFSVESLTRAAFTPPLSAPQHLDEESLDGCSLFVLISYLLPLEEFGLVESVDNGRVERPGEVRFVRTPRFVRFVRMV